MALSLAPGGKDQRTASANWVLPANVTATRVVPGLILETCFWSTMYTTICCELSGSNSTCTAVLKSTAAIEMVAVPAIVAWPSLRSTRLNDTLDGAEGAATVGRSPPTHCFAAQDGSTHRLASFPAPVSSLLSAQFSSWYCSTAVGTKVIVSMVVKSWTWWARSKQV